MRHIVEALAAQGRNGDTTLVHMSKAEVAGLQGLAKRHGTTLTTNPTTGLPEAFGLGSLLPMAAMFVPGLGPLASIALGAGLSGIGAMIDGRDPLQAAAMGGLTGSLGQGMSAAMAPEATAATNATLSAATPMTEAAMSAANTPIDFATMPGASTALKDASMLAPAAPMTQAAQAADTGGMFGISPEAYSQQAAMNNLGGMSSAYAPAAAEAAPMATPLTESSFVPQANLADTTGLAPEGTGIKDPSLLDRGISWVKENPWKSAAIGGAGLYALNSMNQPDVPEDKSIPWHYAPKKTGSTELTPEQIAYNATTQGEKYYTNPNYGYYAGGGILGLPGASMAKSKLKAKEPRPMARAPVHTPYKAPQFLEGRGDGLSDSIYGNIDGKEPVKLASGEFVVPSDVVSHLGNGSSKAGAKHLDRVVKKVRKDKTGTTKQAKAINPGNYLPA
jgi:hypothetical protein